MGCEFESQIEFDVAPPKETENCVKTPRNWLLNFAVTTTRNDIVTRKDYRKQFQKCRLILSRKLFKQNYFSQKEFSLDYFVNFHASIFTVLSKEKYFISSTAPGVT